MFTERRSEAGLLKLDPGARYVARGKGVFIVTRGAGAVEGQPLRALTTIYLAAGETATFIAQDDIELLHFGLPDLAGLRLPATDHAQAAE